MLSPNPAAHRPKNVHWLVTCTAIGLTTLTACISAPAGRTARTESPPRGKLAAASSAELRQRLLDFDFAGEAALPPALPRGSSDQVARFVGGKARSARAWAPADEKLLGVRVDANGEWWSWNNTVALIVTALVRDGVVPETGADLYPELKTSRGYDAFFEMPAKERAARYLGGINPLTGKWYRSFSLHTDEPGGISIEAAGIDQAGMVVTSEGTFGVAEPAPLYPDPAAARPQISGALSVKLWSSDPAKLLLADLVTYSRPSQD